MNNAQKKNSYLEYAKGEKDTQHYFMLISKELKSKRNVPHYFVEFFFL